MKIQKKVIENHVLNVIRSCSHERHIDSALFWLIDMKLKKIIGLDEFLRFVRILDKKTNGSLNGQATN